ncbi:MAG: putative transposase, partial [Mycobacteriales bacterium]
ACRALGVSPSWFYKWRDRPPTPRQDRHAELVDAVWASFKDSGFIYGSPRVWLDLLEAGWRVSVNTVAAVMAEHGWAGRKPPRRRSLTRQGRRPAVPDLVGRRFIAARSDQLWCGDVTYVDTDEGWLYLATVLDLCSRRLLGYAMGDHHDAGLTEAALTMAVTARTGEGHTTRGVVFHSDLAEYSAETFDAACRRLGVVQSMGRVGSALDNAAAEAVNSTIKVELVHRRRFATRAAARAEIGGWISGFYNARRRHSACGRLSPIAYEHLINTVPTTDLEDQAA